MLEASNSIGKSFPGIGGGLADGTGRTGWPQGLSAGTARRGWPMVLVCLTVSTGHAATIHRDCAISGLFFSLVWLYYTYSYAQRQYH